MNATRVLLAALSCWASFALLCSSAAQANSGDQSIETVRQNYSKSRPALVNAQSEIIALCSTGAAQSGCQNACGTIVPSLDALSEALGGDDAQFSRASNQFLGALSGCEALSPDNLQLRNGLASLRQLVTVYSDARSRPDNSSIALLDSKNAIRLDVSNRLNQSVIAACNALPSFKERSNCGTICGSMHKKVSEMATYASEPRTRHLVRGAKDQFSRYVNDCTRGFNPKKPAGLSEYQQLLAWLNAGNAINSPSINKPPVSDSSPGKRPSKSKSETTAGDDTSPSDADRSQYAANIEQLPSQVRGYAAICERSNDQQRCQSMCDLSEITQELATQTADLPIEALAGMQNADMTVFLVNDIAQTIVTNANACAGYFTRDVPPDLITLSNLANDYARETGAVIDRQRNAEAAAQKKAAEERQEELAQIREERKLANEKAQKAYLEQLFACPADSPFSGLSGCAYLDALYKEEFDRAITIELAATAPLHSGILRQIAAEAGGSPYLDLIREGLKGATFVERMLNFYNGFYSAYYPECLGQDPVELTLTTEQQRVYTDAIGVEVARVDLPQQTERLLIPRRLYDKYGSRGFSADEAFGIAALDLAVGDVNPSVRISLADVLMGMTQFMKKTDCDDESILALEQRMDAFAEYRRKYTEEQARELQSQMLNILR